MFDLPEILKSRAGDRHLYAVGRIRALERHFLDRDILRHLIEAPNLKEVYSLLRDTVFGEVVVKTEESLDFERMLNLETRNLIRLIDSMSPDPELTDLFVIPFDVQNLKILLKEELGKAMEPGGFYTQGRFEVIHLKEWIKTGASQSQRPLPDWMIAAVEEVRLAWKKFPKLRIVDAALDRALSLAQLRGAEKARRPILSEFFRFMIDVRNVEAFIRIRLVERSREQFHQFFIPRGNLSLSFFQNQWDTSIREIGRHFEKTAFHDMIVKSLEEYQSEGTLTMLEMEQSRLLIQQLAPSRYITFGPEPILAYMVTRFYEIKILRRIMVAKKNNLPVEGLRKRVMTLYA